MSYRDSHTEEDFGIKYDAGYSSGYNRYQWELCERPILTRICRRFATTPEIRYMDFACGTGRILSVTEQIFENSQGIDVSEQMLIVAKTVTTKSKLIQKDITQFPLKKKLDVITSFRFFTNAEKDLSLAVLSALRESLDENGSLIVGFHRNSTGLLALLHRLRGHMTVLGGPQFMGIKEARTLLEQAGFQVKETIWYSFLPKLSHYPDWFLRLALGPLDTILRSMPFFPKSWAQCYILVCRRDRSIRQPTNMQTTDLNSSNIIFSGSELAATDTRELDFFNAGTSEMDSPKFEQSKAGTSLKVGLTKNVGVPFRGFDGARS